MKLSEAQKKVLDIMEYEVWYCALDLGCSLATLFALQNKGMIRMQQHNGLSLIDSARYEIKWQIIEDEK